MSEVYRGGLDSVPKGQWEAATSLNLSTARTYFRVIIPQALPPSLAGMGNYLVGILKDTPMLSVIGVAELMHTANAIGSETYRFLEPYTLVGVIFLAISAAAGRRAAPLRRLGTPQTGIELMSDADMSGFPLALEGKPVPMVRFKKVTKSYGSLTVLDSLDLDVAEGEMVTVIGPSGSARRPCSGC